MRATGEDRSGEVDVSELRFARPGSATCSTTQPTRASRGSGQFGAGQEYEPPPADGHGVNAVHSIRGGDGLMTQGDEVLGRRSQIIVFPTPACRHPAAHHP
jgi:hypothetical protein